MQAFYFLQPRPNTLCTIQCKHYSQYLLSCTLWQRCADFQRCGRLNVVIWLFRDIKLNLIYPLSVSECWHVVKITYCIICWSRKIRQFSPQWKMCKTSKKCEAFFSCSSSAESWWRRALATTGLKIFPFMHGNRWATLVTVKRWSTAGPQADNMDIIMKMYLRCGIIASACALITGARVKGHF